MVSLWSRGSVLTSTLVTWLCPVSGRTVLVVLVVMDVRWATLPIVPCICLLAVVRFSPRVSSAIVLCVGITCPAFAVEVWPPALSRLLSPSLLPLLLCLLLTPLCLFLLLLPLLFVPPSLPSLVFLPSSLVLLYVLSSLLRFLPSSPLSTLPQLLPPNL